ncbi:hypothetical protein GQX74_002128 [Glossina fuscipes]|nr:hypothetical protein GQX74_002128 [Glossina fuscipes]
MTGDHTTHNNSHCRIENVHGVTIINCPNLKRNPFIEINNTQQFAAGKANMCIWVAENQHSNKDAIAHISIKRGQIFKHQHQHEHQHQYRHHQHHHRQLNSLFSFASHDQNNDGCSSGRKGYGSNRKTGFSPCSEREQMRQRKVFNTSIILRVMYHND